MSCGVGHRLGSGPVWLWLWHRPVATAPVRPLAREPPCVLSVALQKAKKKKKGHTHTKDEVLVHTTTQVALQTLSERSWSQRCILGDFS